MHVCRIVRMHKNSSIMTRPLDIVLILLVLFHNSHSETVECAEDEVVCPENEKWCIARQWICDDQADCPEASDEENCPPKPIAAMLINGEKPEECVDVSSCDERMLSVLQEFSAFVDFQRTSVKHTRSRAFLGFCVTYEYYRECVDQTLRDDPRGRRRACIEGTSLEVMSTIYKAVCNPIVMPTIVQHITCLESTGIVDPLRACAKFSDMKAENDAPCHLVKVYSTFLACATSVKYQVADRCRVTENNHHTLSMIYAQFDRFGAQLNCTQSGSLIPDSSSEDKADVDLQSINDVTNEYEADIPAYPLPQSLFPVCSAERLAKCSKHDLGAYVKPALTQWLPAGKFASIELLCTNFRYLHSCLKDRLNFGRDRAEDPICTPGSNSQTTSLLLLAPFCSPSSNWESLRWQYTKLVEYRRWPVSCFQPVKDVINQAQRETVNFHTICKSASALRDGFDCVSEWFQAQTLQTLGQSSQQRASLITEFRNATLHVMKEMTRQSLEEGCVM